MLIISFVTVPDSIHLLAAQEALLDRASTDPQDFNPKLHMLEDLLLTMIDKHQV